MKANRAIELALLRHQIIYGLCFRCHFNLVYDPAMRGNLLATTSGAPWQNRGEQYFTGGSFGLRQEHYVLENRTRQDVGQSFVGPGHRQEFIAAIFACHETFYPLAREAKPSDRRRDMGLK